MNRQQRAVTKPRTITLDCFACANSPAGPGHKRLDCYVVGGPSGRCAMDCSIECTYAKDCDDCKGTGKVVLDLDEVRRYLGRPACVLALTLVLLGGCPSTGGYGLTPVWQQRGYTMNTSAKCLADPMVIREADLALLIIVREAEAAKLLDYEKVRDLLRHPGVCLIAQPEPCCLGELCTGPNVKAGCSADGWTWVSEVWQGAKRDWSSDQLHELVHVVAYAVGSVYPPNHTGPWAEVERRAQAGRAAIKESTR